MDPITAFIVWAGYNITGALTAIGLSPYAAAAVLDFGIKLATLAGLSKIAENLYGIPDLATSPQSFNVTTRSTLEHQRVIYGETICSGVLTYLNSAGTHNQTLWNQIAIAGHEIESYKDFWLDDLLIPEGYINWVGDTGNVNSGDTFVSGVGANVTFNRFFGTNSQWPNSDMRTNFTDITTYHRGLGIAYFNAVFKFQNSASQVWSAGPPANIKCVVRGKKVYDPRSDSSQSFGTGPHRVNSYATYEWSDNPALCWADYMIDTNLGFGESAARIDYGYVASAANVCEGVVWTPVGTDNRFRCNGVLSAGDTYETNIDRILSSMNGTAVLLNGVWKVRAFSHVTPTISVNEDTLRDDIKIQLNPNENSRFNTVRGYFIDKNRLWQPNQFPEATSSEYVSRDNDVKLYRDISLDMTKDVYAAQRLAIGVLEQSDLEATAIVPTNFKTLAVEVGGTIKLSVDKMGWTDKEFRVMRYKLSDMGGIDLICHEDNVSAYTDVGTAEYAISSGGSYVTNDPGVPAPSSVWVNARNDGNFIQWVTPPARLYETTKVYTATSSDWASMLEIAEVRGDHYLHKYDKPKTYYYYLRSTNYAGELSDKVPNSDYTNIFATAALLGGRNETTFDLSDDIDDFFDDYQLSWIDTTGGENGEHAMACSGSVFSGQASFTRKQYFPIQGPRLSITTRYKINSWWGDDINKNYLKLGVEGYYPTPVTSTHPKFWETDPSTYTGAGNDSTAWFTQSLDTGANWTTVTMTVDLTNAIGSGATLFRPYVVMDSSDTITVANNVNVRFNFWGWYWQ